MGESFLETEGQTVSGRRTPSPEESLIRQEEASLIRTALSALSEEYREVLLLKHLEGHSYREMARLLRTSVRAVESRLFRARQQLGRQLARLREVADQPRPPNRRAPGEPPPPRSERTLPRRGEMTERLQ